MMTDAPPSMSLKPEGFGRPLIVGLGGSTSPGGASERMLRYALSLCAGAGAQTLMFDGAALDMPMYRYGVDRSTQTLAFVDGIRRADGLLIASPGYHGTVSGLIKNALDYVQDLAEDPRPYFEGRAVGLIALAAGWQATGTTLNTLRSIVHALRGWPTPMAVTVNTISPLFDAADQLADPALDRQCAILARQVVHFARMHAATPLHAGTDGAHQGARCAPPEPLIP